jgi:hypothetical protein
LVDVLRSEAVICTRGAWDELSQRIDGKGNNTEVAA